MIKGRVKMFFSQEERNLAIDLLECVNNTKELNDCQHFVNKLKKTKELYRWLNGSNFFKTATKNILGVLAQHEALDIQSKRTRNIIQNLYIDFLHTDEHIFVYDKTLEEIKLFFQEHEEKLYQEKYQEYKKNFFKDIDAPKKEKFHFGHNMSQIADGQ